MVEGNGSATWSYERSIGMGDVEGGPGQPACIQIIYAVQILQQNRRFKLHQAEVWGWAIGVTRLNYTSCNFGGGQPLDEGSEIWWWWRIPLHVYGRKLMREMAVVLGHTGGHASCSVWNRCHLIGNRQPGEGSAEWNYRFWAVSGGAGTTKVSRTPLHRLILDPTVPDAPKVLNVKLFSA